MLISLSLRLQSAGTQPNVRCFFLLPARVQQSHLHTQLKCTSHCFRCHVYEAIPGFGYGRTQTNSMYINCCPQSQETSRGSARRRGGRRRRRRGSERRRAVECLSLSYCAASVVGINSGLTASAKVNTTSETQVEGKARRLRGKLISCWESGEQIKLEF